MEKSLIYPPKLSSKSAFKQEVRNFVGGACRTKHFWLGQYSWEAEIMKALETLTVVFVLSDSYDVFFVTCPSLPSLTEPESFILHGSSNCFGTAVNSGLKGPLKSCGFLGLRVAGTRVSTQTTLSQRDERQTHRLETEMLQGGCLLHLMSNTVWNTAIWAY